VARREHWFDLGVHADEAIARIPPMDGLLYDVRYALVASRAAIPASSHSATSPRWTRGP